MHRASLTSFLLAGILIPQPLAPQLATLPFFTDAAEANESGTQVKEIRLLLSLMWEGPSVETVNLEALKTFRTNFSNIPVTHFISPSYFSEANPDAEANKNSIFSLNRPGDFVGISIAPWKSIVTKAGVLYRNGPTFWGNAASESACARDCGNDIPLSIYTPDEIRKIISESLRVMNTNGFSYLRGMQVRGWMATPEVLTIAEQAGINYDFSMVTTSIVSNQLRSYPLFSWIKNLWPKGDILSQPGIMPDKTPVMIEVPQALGALDYVSHKQMLGFLDAILASPSKVPMTYHIVMHAETAHITLSKLELVLQGVFKQAAEGKFRLSMMNLPDMEWNPPNVKPMVRESREADAPDRANVH